MARNLTEQELRQLLECLYTPSLGAVPVLPPWAYGATALVFNTPDGPKEVSKDDYQRLCELRLIDMRLRAEQLDAKGDVVMTLESKDLGDIPPRREVTMQVDEETFKKIQNGEVVGVSVGGRVRKEDLEDWGIDRTVGDPIDMRGTPLTREVLEEAAEIIKNEPLPGAVCVGTPTEPRTDFVTDPYRGTDPNQPLPDHERIAQLEQKVEVLEKQRNSVANRNSIVTVAFGLIVAVLVCTLILVTNRW